MPGESLPDFKDRMRNLFDLQAASPNPVFPVTNLAQVAFVDQIPIPFFTIRPCPDDCVNAPQVTQTAYADVLAFEILLQDYLNFVNWLGQQL